MFFFDLDIVYFLRNVLKKVGEINMILGLIINFFCYGFIYVWLVKVYKNFLYVVLVFVKWKWILLLIDEKIELKRILGRLRSLLG